MGKGVYKWWVVAMLWFVCFFNYADRQAIFSVFPLLREKMGLDNIQLGFVGSAFMWVYALGAPLAGFIGDRVRRKDLILGGCLFWSGVTVTTGWCSRLWQFGNVERPRCLVRALRLALKPRGTRTVWAFDSR